jgi:hypothetical protein
MKINNLVKKIAFFVVLIFPDSIIAQVGINSDNSSPHPSAQLDVKSTNKGLLLPRITSPNSAISSPAAGLVVYDQANANLSYYNGANWSNLTGSAGNQGLYSRFPNSIGYPSITNTADPNYMEYTWTKPAGITQIWIEMWAAGNQGGSSPQNFGPTYGNQFEGGSSGDFASFILNVSSLASITLRVGKGGYRLRNGGATVLIIGENNYSLFQASGNLYYNSISIPIEGLINFVSGTKGEQITMSHGEYATGQFVTYLNGGKGADAYPNQKGGHGISGNHTTLSPYLYSGYSNYGLGHGATPAAGGGFGFTDPTNAGNGGNGLAIIHW